MAKHSAWFNKIKRWYAIGSWIDEMVANAVVKGKITAEEYEEITGKPYATEEEENVEEAEETE